MSLLLYQIGVPEGGKCVGQVELTGKLGIFAGLVRSRSVRSSDRFEWRLTASEILDRAGLADQNHALFVERNTTEDGSEPYASLKEIWGFSGPDSTTVLLRLESVFPGFGSTEHPPMWYQLLQLNGGTVKQDWSWTTDAPEKAPMFSSEVVECLIRSAGWQLSSPEAVEGESRAKRVPSASRSSRDQVKDERLNGEMRRDLNELFGSPREKSSTPSIPESQISMRDDAEAIMGENTQEAPEAVSSRPSSIKKGSASYGRQLKKPKVRMVRQP